MLTQVKRIVLHFWWSSMFLSFVGFLHQIILILFLFSKKHSYLFILLKFFNTMFEDLRSIKSYHKTEHHHKRRLWRCSGHFFASKFLKEIYITVILFFCFWTSQPQNVLNLFFFCQFQPRYIYKVSSYKKVFNYL